MADRDNTGVLFKNDRKQKPNQPDYTGKATIDGEEKRIAAWVKEGKKGKFMSLAFDEPQERPQREESEDLASEGMDSDIPF